MSAETAAPRRTCSLERSPCCPLASTSSFDSISELALEESGDLTGAAQTSREAAAWARESGDSVAEGAALVVEGALSSSMDPDAVSALPALVEKVAPAIEASGDERAQLELLQARADIDGIACCPDSAVVHLTAAHTLAQRLERHHLATTLGRRRISRLLQGSAPTSEVRGEIERLSATRPSPASVRPMVAVVARSRKHVAGRQARGRWDVDRVARRRRCRGRAPCEIRHRLTQGPRREGVPFQPSHLSCRGIAPARAARRSRASRRGGTGDRLRE